MCHAPVNCLCVSLCVKEQKEIQEATLEASTVQHVLMCPACFLGNYLSLPRNHYKQAAMQANAQALQAGAVACGSMGSMSAVCRPAGRSSASSTSTRVCSRTAEQVLATCGARSASTHGRWSVAAQSWSTPVVSRSRRDFRKP